jgi:hypothetical protein
MISLPLNVPLSQHNMKIEGLRKKKGETLSTNPQRIKYHNHRASFLSCRINRVWIKEYQHSTTQEVKAPRSQYCFLLLKPRVHISVLNVNIYLRKKKGIDAQVSGVLIEKFLKWINFFKKRKLLALFIVVPSSILSPFLFVQI